MKKTKHPVMGPILVGLIPLLTIGILLMFFSWLFNFVTAMVRPITQFMFHTLNFPNFVGDALVIAIILALSFFAGIFTEVKIGKLFYNFVEGKLFNIIPLYSFVRDILKQILERDKLPFSAVAMVQPLKDDPDFLFLAFVTDRDDENIWTIFYPTSPNPTSGLTLFVPKERVHIVDISVEEAFKKIISCGLGSGNLLAELRGCKEAKKN